MTPAWSPTRRSAAAPVVVVLLAAALPAAYAEILVLGELRAGESGIRIIYLDDPVRYYAGMPP